MTLERIDGVLAKLDRADEHLKSLEAELAVFLRRKPYVISGNLNREERTWSFRLESTRSPDIRLATIIGDIAHNLRSALDHLVWQLVAAAGGKPGTHTQFPIALTREKWRDRNLGATRRLRGLNLTAAAEIQRLQPYLARNPSGSPVRHPLAVLNKISNTDKHSLLLPTLGVLQGLRSAMYVCNDVGGIEEVVVLVEPGSNLEDGTDLVRVKLLDPIGSEPEVTMEGLPPFEVALGKDGPPPDETLATISDFIRVEVIPRFVRFLA